jgi:hypothetical protein
MKIKMLFVALALMAFASVSNAQFNAIIYSLNPFPSLCVEGSPIYPDGTTGYVYWDQNQNGPDAADQLAPVGDLGANFNTFFLNGVDYLGQEGAFYTDPAFTYASIQPVPNVFYVVIEGATSRWTSRLITINPGFSEHDVTEGWSCQLTQAPCDEPTFIGINTVGGRDFIANGPYSQCVRICAGTTVQICLGPLAADERPHALVLPGCLGNGCDVECPPAQYGYDDLLWTYNPTNGTWCNVIIAGTDGCVCFRLEFIEGALDVQLSVEPRDGSVDLAWTTASETEMERYDVRRRVVGHEFTTIGSVAATNAATESHYTFVDENAANGTMYEYTLQMVDVSGNVTELGTIASATPSVDAAVVTEYALHQNYPNPFNPSTNLVFDVVAENNVNLTVYNAMGQEVATLVNGTMAAGRHTVSFDAANLTSGLYFYTVKIGNEFTATKKMLLVK